jgi:microcin C transport system substrate-binding protein
VDATSLGAISVKLSRRSVLRSGAATFAVPAATFLSPLGDLTTPARAQEQPWKHGLSLFGDLKYPAGFKHFDYVNPNAPKGGTIRLGGFGTFDNFNVVIRGVKGSIVAAIDLIYERLMSQAFDEVTTEYGQIAEAVRHPADFSAVSYRLRADAKWHDGKPITVEDVIFSFEAYKKYHPQYSAYYKHVTKIEKSGEREVTFTFDGPGNRELPQIVGQFAVLPKHWWEGTDAQGRKRDISATTLEIPLGSGAYRVKEFTAGRTISYERVKDHWAKDLNINIGRDNFDEIRYEYFRDATVVLEAFKGDVLDWRTENSAKNWATAYDFPAVKDKRVVLEEFAVRSSGVMQAFVFNTRREKFQDWRVRRAMNFAFDFEEMNKQIFFGQYKRIASYFEGLELASSGLPEGKELEILETVRDKVPVDLFTKPYTNPVGGSPDNVRSNLREGLRLLREAGYEVRNQKLTNVKTGETFTIEFLVSAGDPNGERFVSFYKPSLERLGMTVSIRAVDDTQFVNRERNRDFDALTNVWGQSLSPGNEQRGNWGSQAADQPGSENLIGIKNPAVDAMIERVIFAKDRAELVAATKALDRVLLWNHYVVPQWTYGKQRAARWDRFGRPETMPEYAASAFPTIWWWDPARAAKTGSR